MQSHVCWHVCLQEGVPDEFEVVYVGSLSVDVDVMEQEVRGGAAAAAVAAACGWACLLQCALCGAVRSSVSG
jgi:hypothetical protein